MSMSQLIEVQEDPRTGDLFIEIPDDILEAAGLKIGDDVEFVQREDGNWVIRKKDETSTMDETE